MQTSLIYLRRKPGSCAPSGNAWCPGRLQVLPQWLAEPRAGPPGRLVWPGRWKGQVDPLHVGKCSRDRAGRLQRFCNGRGLCSPQPAEFNAPCNGNLLLTRWSKTPAHRSPERMDLASPSCPLEAGPTTGGKVRPESLQNFPLILTFLFFSLGAHHPLNNSWF